MNFAQNLVNLQNELLLFAYKLTADHEEANDLLQETSLKVLDNEEKYMPDTNFKGWVYTIMRNIFINNYRKSLRDQTYVDQTDNQFYLNQGAGLEADSMGCLRFKGNAPCRKRFAEGLPHSVCHVCFGIQVSGDCR